ncbi:MAG TPA: glycosyltransferase family 39 protein [Coleofasciculaceae cyanobacterium]|jgi:uncharacterized membrane protein
MDRQERKFVHDPQQWLRAGAIALLILGIFFRFYQLDEKVYWLDEARTSLRMSGHTKAEFIQEVYTGQVISLDTLQQYQRPGEAIWGDTFNALRGNAEHTPLYFVLARLWTEAWGYSVTTIRSLSAVISLLVFPCLFWFCQELFHKQEKTSQAIAWVALSLVAISPLHVLYAQEARPYSLWTVMTLLSSAMLLRSLRSPGRTWIAYGVTIALGLYTQLLFALVILAHGLYVAIVARRQVISYGLATLGGVLAFAPWLVLLLSQIEQVNAATVATTRQYPLSYLLDQWFLNINRVFINGELNSFNLLLVILTGITLYWLWRKTQPQIWVLIVCLIAVPFLALALPDVFAGGERSLRLRYLIPCYLGIQITFAYFFTTQALWAKRWGQKFWRLVLILLLASGILACAVNTQTQVGWTKSIRKSGYYPIAASWINYADRPLVISDEQSEDLLSFSYELKPEVKFQLVTQPRRLKIAEGYGTVFLLNPSARLKNLLERRDYRLLLLCQDDDDYPGDPVDRLWLLKAKES